MTPPPVLAKPPPPLTMLLSRLGTSYVHLIDPSPGRSAWRMDGDGGPKSTTARHTYTVSASTPAMP